MIIDAHAHADEFQLFGWMDPPERVISLMDRAGIDISIGTTYADGTTVRIARDATGRIVARTVDPSGAPSAVTWPAALAPAAAHTPIYSAALTILKNRISILLSRPAPAGWQCRC